MNEVAPVVNLQDDVVLNHEPRSGFHRQDRRCWTMLAYIVYVSAVFFIEQRILFTQQSELV
jgi:hypothetical protein